MVEHSVNSRPDEKSTDWGRYQPHHMTAGYKSHFQYQRESDLLNQ